MHGGPGNPLGVRAMYLWQNGKDTLFRIHGTVEPWTIGKSVSSGCIRMINQDVIDLYEPRAGRHQASSCSAQRSRSAERTSCLERDEDGAGRDQADAEPIGGAEPLAEEQRAEGQRRRR